MPGCVDRGKRGVGILRAIPTTRLAPEQPLVDRPLTDRPRFSPRRQPELLQVYVFLRHECAQYQGASVTSLQVKVR